MSCYFNFINAEDEPIVRVVNKYYGIDVEHGTAHLIKGDIINSNVVIDSVVVYNGREYPVTKVDSRTFYNCDLLVSVTLPNSVVEIGDYVFAGCDGLIDFCVLV